MHRRCLVIDEPEGVLALRSEAALWAKRRPTAIVNKPHFVVSTLRLLRLTCHPSGVILSVAMYM